MKINTHVRVDPSVLGFSLLIHRHPHICIPCISVFPVGLSVVHYKIRRNRIRRRGLSRKVVWIRFFS